MRIAIIADPLDNQSAGVHTYTRFMVDSLIANKGQNEIILIREKRDDSLEGCQQIIIPNTRLPIGFASIRLFVIVPLILMIHKVDVVIEPAHFGPFNLPRSIKRVTVIHDLTPLLFPQYHRWHSQLLQRLFLPGILKRTDLIISNSKNTTTDLINRFPDNAHKVRTLLLGKDPFYSRTDLSDKLKELGITVPYFHFVGTIEPRKDLITLLEAYNIFRTAHPEHKTKLIIAGGKGWKSDTFFEKLETHPFNQDIIVPGYLSKEAIRQLHSHSQGLIYTTKYEGFGLPVLEALSCGCRVFTAKNSSLPEVGGKYAHYFETGNKQEIAALMINFYSANSSKMDVTNFVEWSDTFSWTTFGRELLRHLNQTV